MFDIALDTLMLPIEREVAADIRKRLSSLSWRPNQIAVIRTHPVLRNRTCRDLHEACHQMYRESGSLAVRSNINAALAIAQVREFSDIAVFVTPFRRRLL